MITQIWNQAKEAASQTPADRNRYIDFLRAASILFVVFGHWLMASAVYDPATQEVNPISTLEVLPWTQWLTWIFQVMPIFFFVGGYSNALSLERAKQKNQHFSDWFSGRLYRLLKPLLLLLITWAGISFGLNLFGVEPEKIASISQLALVPTWFLSIYALICMLAPISYAFWQRFGWASFFIYVALAILTDVVFFQTGIEELGIINYFWVWLAVHHLGYAWYNQRVAKPGVMIILGIAGYAALWALIFLGPYSLAMAGSPEDEVSNSLPPKITLIALGLGQFGFVVALEKPMKKLLQNVRLWASTVLISSMIMSVYLWHMTLLLIVIAICWFFGGIGLNEHPSTLEWWLHRPLWLGGLFILLLPIAQILSPLEKAGKPDGKTTPSVSRLVTGTLCAAAGIGVAAMIGYAGDLNSISFIASFVLAIGGAAICGVRVRS